MSVGGGCLHSVQLTDYWDLVCHRCVGVLGPSRGRDELNGLVLVLHCLVQLEHLGLFGQLEVSHLGLVGRVCGLHREVQSWKTMCFVFIYSSRVSGQ